MNLGRLSSAALFASGVAGAVIPVRVANALEMSVVTPRGRTETRVGLGGTYAGLGLYGLLSRSPAAQRAVGFTWLGAAVTRLATKDVDDVTPDWTYWTYLAGEIGLGVAAIAGSVRRR
jgi:hypothetical protein